MLNIYVFNMFTELASCMALDMGFNSINAKVKKTLPMTKIYV